MATKRVLSDHTIETLRQQGTLRVRQAITQRHTGAPVQVNSFARDVETAVLEHLQEYILQARRYQHLKERYGAALLDAVLACPDPTIDEAQECSNRNAANHLDQIADATMEQEKAHAPAPAHNPATGPFPFQLPDLDLSGLSEFAVNGQNAPRTTARDAGQPIARSAPATTEKPRPEPALLRLNPADWAGVAEAYPRYLPSA